MLNRSQIYTLLMLRKRGGNLFAALPRELVRYIGNIDNRADVEITALLHHIAYGNLADTKKMLDANPRLVLQSAHTETPSGLRVLHTTPLECALGAGDPDMAVMIVPYFEAKEIVGGAKVRDEQVARYRQSVKGILDNEKNPPYDFTLLIETFMAATSEDVTAALNLDMTYESALCDALVQFRKDFTPGTITRGMHFNYLNLLRAYEVYDQYYSVSLSQSGKNCFDKLKLFSRQVIGFIQRSLPAIDRMAFARGVNIIAVTKITIPRSFKFEYFNEDFPITAGDSSCNGLGYQYWDCETVWRGAVTAERCAASFGKLILRKKCTLEELMRSQREEIASRCVIL